MSGNPPYVLPMRIHGIFTDHPASVGETWRLHARFALSMAGTLTAAALAAAVHAVVPALFPTTASRAIDRLHERVHGIRGSDAARITTVERSAA